MSSPESEREPAILERIMHTMMSEGSAVAAPRPVLGTLHVWALGVGIVVCGQYFGWNEGLKGNGPVAMLAASLLVCLLFLAWTLTLSELAVAMPTAGGPLDWGLRAGGPWLGFVMGWSMLLECFFGGVATALAGGNYVAFLLDHDQPSATVTVVAGLAIVFVFFLLQTWGVPEQAWALVFMTFGALLALAVFWIVAGMNFSWERAWPSPPLPPGRGWRAVVDAVPWALWWLIIIEGAALAAEDTRCPAHSIPRGLTAAVLTTAVLLVFTLGTACGALDSAEVAEQGGKTVHFPLAAVLNRISEDRWLLLVNGFCTVALLGLVASYHGLLYSTSRQLFALGRDHYLPAWLGSTHATRKTPVPALALASVLTAGFVIANLWFERDTLPFAVLAAGFAALVLYLLSMVSRAVAPVAPARRDHSVGARPPGVPGTGLPGTWRGAGRLRCRRGLVWPASGCDSSATPREPARSGRIDSLADAAGQSGGRAVDRGAPRRRGDLGRRAV
jgi:ethanolamine permease